MSQIDETLALVKELHSHSIINSDDYYSEKLLQVIIALSTLNITKDTDSELSNDEKLLQDEIEKVKRKVPKWMKKTHQYNYQILKAFMELSDNNANRIEVEALEKYVNIGQAFLANYNNLKTISEKNHGKVFDEIDREVELWEPVAEFVEKIFFQQETKHNFPKYLFNGKIYQKNKKSGDSLGNLLFDIFKLYLDENPYKSYIDLQSIFNPLHKTFSSQNSKKKVVFNDYDFEKWFSNETTNDSKKESRYFGYGAYGNPIKYNNESIYFTTQWGNADGEYGNINTFIDFAKNELGYNIEII